MKRRGSILKEEERQQLIKTAGEPLADLIQKGSLLVGDLESNGGKLTDIQTDAFIRLLIEGGQLLPYINVIPMRGPTHEYNGIKFNSTILRPAKLDPTSSGTGWSGRSFTEDWDSEPTTTSVKLETIRVRAEVPIGDELLEDSIEREAIYQTIVDLMIEKISQEVELQMLQGDTSLNAATYPFLSMKESLLDQATTHVVNAGGQPLAPALINKIKKQLPNQYKKIFSRYMLVVDQDTYCDLQTSIASRATAYGDQLLQSSVSQIRSLGIPIMGVDQMPSGTALLFNPDNVLYGVQRYLKVERERAAREERDYIIATMAYDFKYFEEPAVVKVTNIGALPF